MKTQSNKYYYRWLNCQTLLIAGNSFRYMTPSSGSELDEEIGTTFSTRKGEGVLASQPDDVNAKNASFTDAPTFL